MLRPVPVGSVARRRQVTLAAGDMRFDPASDNHSVSDMSFRITLILFFVAGVQVPSFAQGVEAKPGRPLELTYGPPTPRTPVNGRVTGLNLVVFEKLKAIRATGTTIRAPDAQQLKTAILADASVDPEEWDLLDELSQQRTRAITITAVSTGETSSPNSVMLSSVSGEARTILIGTIPVADLDKLWNEGATGWAALIAEYERGGVTAVRTTYFVVDKLAAEWRQSSTATAYNPFRTVVNDLYKQCDLLGEKKNSGRALLRQALKLVDDYDEGKVPDFLYNWINPEAAPK